MTARLTALMMLIAAPVYATNLIENGDFESGYTGFTSGYNRVDLPDGDLLGEGSYSITYDPSYLHPIAGSVLDHTSAMGLMFVANGAMDASTAVWQYTVTDAPLDTDLTFSVWLANWHAASPATLALSVNGTLVQTFQISEPQIVLVNEMPEYEIGVWEQASTIFNSGTTGVLELSIHNLNTSSMGNDFAMDDLYLGTGEEAPDMFMMSFANPEPTTLLMLSLGGIALCRRKKRGAC